MRTANSADRGKPQSRDLGSQNRKAARVGFDHAHQSVVAGSLSADALKSSLAHLRWWTEKVGRAGIMPPTTPRREPGRRLAVMQAIDLNQICQRYYLK